MAATTVVLATAAIACGQGDDGSSGGREASPARDADAPGAVRAVETAVRDLQRSFVANDIPGVCSQTSRAAQRQAGLAAHGQPTTCRRDVRRLLAMIEEGGGWRHAGKPKLAGVEIDRDRATATVKLGDWSSDVPLAREAGRWKLNSFFGAPPEQSRTAAARAAGKAHPGAGATALEVIDSSIGAPSPCLDVYAASAEIGGGCTISASGESIGLKVLTAFGDFDFALCSTQYGIVVDSTGRTWTTGITVESLDERRGAACGDVDECRDANDRPVPWKGRIQAAGDGTFRHRFHACFETCIGLFEGDVEMTLVRQGRDWRLEADRASFGASGFAMGGRLDAGSDELAIRTADS